MEGYSGVDPDVESGGGMNQVMVEDVVELAPIANTNRTADACRFTRS
jgi:hypothetical protein